VLSSGAAAWLGSGTPWDKAFRVLAVLTGFSIPLSTSFSEITTGLFMACWLLSGELEGKWDAIRRNRVALVSLALFGVLAAGITWSSESWTASGRCLLKYRELLYLPMFVVVFREATLQRLAIWAYMAAAVLLLALSYFERFSGADFGIVSTSVDYVIAKDRIIHSLMMGLLAYLAAVQLAGTRTRVLPSPPGRGAGGKGAGHFAFPAVTRSSGEEARIGRAWRWTCAAIVPLAVYNILFMVQGRTGYIVLGALTALFLYERLSRRGLAIACLVLGLAGGAALQFSTMIRGRVEQTISQLKNQFGGDRKHSADPRMEFYVNTLRLIRRHPVLGTGTGSFRSEYARLVAGSDDIPTSDPHNEYLHLASQVGIPGAILFLALLAVQWRATGRLEGLSRDIGRGVVLTIALGSLFNSLILSVTGGLIFAYFGGLVFAELSLDAAVARSSAGGMTAESDSPGAKRRAA
jgi:O-antigen ligase